MNRILLLIVLVVGCGGPPDGPVEIYLDNGRLWEKTTYKDGVQDGPFESYHENGQVRDRGIYKGDKKCGEWVEGNETVTYNPC
jgi:antitoxin component YwqK of YwqJK toxin-antitoxin module